MYAFLWIMAALVAGDFVLAVLIGRRFRALAARAAQSRDDAGLDRRASLDQMAVSVGSSRLSASAPRGSRTVPEAVEGVEDFAGFAEYGGMRWPR
jgi:hypothetical protein